MALGCQRRHEAAPAEPAAQPGMSDFAAATAALSADCEGGGFLQARLRGAIEADLDWHDAAMHCEGGPRPDGRGVRVALGGPLPSDAMLRLRFIFGIADRDVASGSALALPTNVTVIVEGDGRMFATRGDGRCAVELLQREPLPGSPRRERVHARGYCLDPAASLNSDERLHVPTFEFSGVVDAGEQP